MPKAWRLILTLVLGALVLPAEAETLRDVRAVRGDLLAAKVGRYVVHFELVGVWVPKPPGVSYSPEYQGSEARDFVAELLATERVVVKPLERLTQKRPVRARVLVGEETPRELTTLLAEQGLALWSPSALVPEKLSTQVHAAEREARRSLRGLHDGGFQQFEWTRNLTKDFGQIFLDFDPRRFGDQLYVPGQRPGNARTPVSPELLRKPTQRPSEPILQPGDVVLIVPRP